MERERREVAMGGKVAWLALAAAAVGCGNNRFVGGPLPAAAPIYRIVPGASVTVSPTGLPGYVVTANLGGSYRLTWTGSSTEHLFQGSLWTTGRFTEKFPGCQLACPIEKDDFVSGSLTTPGANRIDFDSTTGSDLDGFDFIVDTEPVYFDLLVDSVRNPELVLFPSTDLNGQAANPGEDPFGLTSQ